MRTEASIEIDRPIQEVFDYTNDHVAEWSITVVEDEVLDSTPDRVGTRFRTVTQNQGRRMDFEGVVTHYEPPHASAVELRGNAFDIDVAYLFEDLGGRTKVTQVSHVRGKGFFKLLLLLFGWLGRTASCQAAQNELQNLKFLLEAGPKTTTPGGDD